MFENVKVLYILLIMVNTDEKDPKTGLFVERSVQSGLK